MNQLSRCNTTSHFSSAAHCIWNAPFRSLLFGMHFLHEFTISSAQVPPQQNWSCTFFSSASAPPLGSAGKAVNASCTLRHQYIKEKRGTARCPRMSKRRVQPKTRFTSGADKCSTSSWFCLHFLLSRCSSAGSVYMFMQDGGTGSELLCTVMRGRLIKWTLSERTLR